MGCCASTPQDAKDNKHRSEEIDAHLKLEMKRQRHEVKLLLLGTIIARACLMMVCPSLC